MLRVIYGRNAEARNITDSNRFHSYTYLAPAIIESKSMVTGFNEEIESNSPLL